MVEETLTKLSKLLSREKELFSKPLPERGRHKEAEIYHRQMEETFRELQALEKGCLQELVQMAADKVKERELFRELAFLQEMYRQREENIALCREKLEFTAKELDRVRVEKKAHLSYYPGRKQREAVFVDSTI